VFFEAFLIGAIFQTFASKEEDQRPPPLRSNVSGGNPPQNVGNLDIGVYTIDLSPLYSPCIVPGGWGGEGPSVLQIYSEFQILSFSCPVLNKVHCCVLQIACIQGTPLYRVSSRTLHFLAISAINVDHIDTYPPVLTRCCCQFPMFQGRGQGHRLTLWGSHRFYDYASSEQSHHQAERQWYLLVS
jgi:hypothetical protein